MKAASSPSSHPADLSPLYRQVLDTLTDMVSIVSEDGTIVYTNAALQQRLGYAPGELTGRPATVLHGATPEQGRYRTREILAAAAATGSWSGDWPNRCKDGTVMPASARVTRLAHGGRTYLVTQSVPGVPSGGTGKNEDRLRQLEGAIREVFYISDPHQGTIVYVSPGYERIWGEPLESLYEDPASFLARIHADDRDQVRDKLPLQAQGHNTEAEYRVVRRDGSVRWVWDRATPIRGEDGQVIRIAGLAEDITARKQAEEELRASNQTLTAFVEACPLAVMILEPDTTVRLWNPAAEKLYGWPAEEVLGRPLPAIPPDRLAEFHNNLENVFHGRPVVGVDTQRLRKDGTRFHAQLWTAALTTADGRRQCLSIVADVTARKRSEEALRESEERQRLAADAGQIGLWDWDIVHDKVVWSDRIHEFHGLGAAEFPGTVDAFARVVHPEDRDRVGRSLRAALDHDHPYRLEFRTVRPDGEVRWLSTNAQVLRDAAGRPVRMLGATTDITERRQTEDALRKANADLEEFAYVSSHDLQEPLRMVAIYTQLLLRGSLVSGPKAEQYAGIISAAVKRMEELIQDLLSYSRIIHQDTPHSLLADTNGALREALRMLEPRMQETGAHIQIAGPLPAVRADARQIALVFQNLIANSLKYCQENASPEITISAEEEGENWVITVRDKGIGFDQHYAGRIFGLFKRLHKDEYPGTGLGLAICQRIVERFGGRIWAEGEVGVGAAFHFVLPAAPTSP